MKDKKISKYVLIVRDNETGEIEFTGSLWDSIEKCEEVFCEIWKETHRIWCIAEISANSINHTVELFGAARLF
jgi:hypothetical protein